LTIPSLRGLLRFADRSRELFLGQALPPIIRTNGIGDNRHFRQSYSETQKIVYLKSRALVADRTAHLYVSFASDLVRSDYWLVPRNIYLWRLK